MSGVKSKEGGAEPEKKSSRAKTGISVRQRQQWCAPRKPKFQGRCDKLKGFVFDFFDSSKTETFNKTLKDLTLYIGRMFAYGKNIQKTIDNDKVFRIPMPEDINNETVNAAEK